MRTTLRHVVVMGSIMAVPAGCAAPPAVPRAAPHARPVAAHGHVAPAARAVVAIDRRADVHDRLRRARLLECRIALAPPLRWVSEARLWGDSARILADAARHWAVDAASADERSSLPRMSVLEFAHHVHSGAGAAAGPIGGRPDSEFDAASDHAVDAASRSSEAARAAPVVPNVELGMRLCGLAFLASVLLTPALCSYWAARNGAIGPPARPAASPPAGKDIGALAPIG